jgi:hypothetical protein
MTGSLIMFDLFTHVKTIQLRHHHIADDDVRDFFKRYLKTLLSISR